MFCRYCRRISNRISTVENKCVEEGRVSVIASGLQVLSSICTINSPNSQCLVIKNTKVIWIDLYTKFLPLISADCQRFCANWITSPHNQQSTTQLGAPTILGSMFAPGRFGRPSAIPPLVFCILFTTAALAQDFQSTSSTTPRNQDYNFNDFASTPETNEPNAAPQRDFPEDSPNFGRNPNFPNDPNFPRRDPNFNNRDPNFNRDLNFNNRDPNFNRDPDFNRDTNFNRDPNLNRDPNFNPRDPNDLNYNYNRENNPDRDPLRENDFGRDNFNNRNEFPDAGNSGVNRDSFGNSLNNPPLYPSEYDRDRDSGRPPWQENRLGDYDSKGAPPIEQSSVIINDATYFIVASRMVRPGQVYKVSISILRARLRMLVRASISNNGVEMTHVTQEVRQGIPETLNMRVPPTSVPGEYKLRVEGLYDDPFDGKAFLNETRLTFSRRFMTIFIQMDKPVYMQGQTVRFRTIPINTELKAFNNAIDVYILDPNRKKMKRWLSRQSNLGTVSLEYKLSDQPVFGEWTVQVMALGQIEESTFLVEEYYQTRFEVNVTMPAFFFTTDRYIHGRIMANYTSGAPVKGNLTLKATIRPIPEFRPMYYERGQYNNQGPFGIPTSQYERDRDQYNRNQYNDVRNQFYPGTNPNEFNTNPYENINRQLDENGNPIFIQGGAVPSSTDILNQPGYVYDYSKVVERHFNFDEEFPFWMTKPDPYHSNHYGGDYNLLPYLRFFNGTYEFRYPMRELESYVPTLDGMEVIITATVGERFLDEIIEGYSVARIYNSSINVNFLGGTPQVFKPAMPFDCYIAASFHDSSPLRPLQLGLSVMEVTSYVEMRTGGRRDLPPMQVIMDQAKPGIWHLKVDLRTQLNLDETRNAKDVLNDISQMRLTAHFRDGLGQSAQGELLLLGHHSPMNHQIKVSTSTQDAKVGEYIVLHVQSNFYMEFFNYLVMSKGIILTTSQENMQDSIRTFAVTLSAEMAPAATIVVWSTGRHGDIVADSLTVPVNGISRNNFTVFINNRKARTGEKVEVAIYGEPGSYVGLSGIDNAFYTMQAGNELTYAHVITKMATFDEQTNGTFKHSWLSHEGTPDELIYFPSSTFGIDANRTFEYAGLVVFSDVQVSRRPDYCNYTMGYGECLNGRCYRVEKKCDGVYDCEDGTDEAGCDLDQITKLTHFRKFRFNRIQRQYDNVWLWKDINIGPHGRFIFNVEVPKRPAQWMVSAFSMSPSLGFGMLPKAIEYEGVLPFFMNLEMPEVCRQGEQVGVRATVFNYMLTAIEATVVLAGSPDYKFVHVEEFGIVPSYNPRTSFGEHQFFVYIPAGEAMIVHLPVVPQRLGEIHVTIHATTLIGKDTQTKRLYVEADGLPQYRHQSILLDLSNRAYIFQYLHVNVTETPIIPYDVDRYYVFGSNKARVSIVGDVVGPIFPTMPINATTMLNLPMDSAEQTMFSFAANLYTVLYMRHINQRNRTTERHAFYHLNTLYQRQLSFLKPDGSFSLFRSDWNQSTSSVWLTAFCARTFQDSSFYEWENYIYIDPSVISNAISWILDHQSQDGAFYEEGWLADRKVNTSLHWPWEELQQRNISLTAHCIITLVTVKDLKDKEGGLGARVALGLQKAVQWLERNMKLLDEHGEPYHVAIVAYALLVSKASSGEQAFGILAKHARREGGLMYWGKEAVPMPPYKQENQKPFLLPRLPYMYDSTNIETTAYALMVYNARQELIIDPIVMWLNSQRLTDGGWASTQDTYMAMRALIDYTARKRLRDVSTLTLSVEATALPGQTKNLYVNNDNIAVLQSIDIPQAWGTVKVQAKGAGYAILQMSVQYNVDIEKFQTEPPVRAFDLYTRANFHGRNQSHITYQSCQRWTNLNESIRSGMAVLDVGIPTGYIIQQQKLDAYILSRSVRNLQRARFQDRKVLFYFDYLDHEDTCINFTIERWFPVANMSRYLPIRVYDYYAPERFNETIFDALPTYLLNICEVCGSSQCPYCSIYNAATSSPAFSVMTLILVAAISSYLSGFRTHLLLRPLFRDVII